MNLFGRPGMQIVKSGRVLTATGIGCFTLTMLFTPVIADTANKQDKAKQPYPYSNNYHYKQHAIRKLKNRRHAHRNSSNQFLQPPVLDSRFPNSYKQYEYYLKQKEQSYRNH